jgi:hypothetical protein
LRIFIGGQVSDSIVSEWLLGFSVFLFFGLALLKRYNEVLLLTVNSSDGKQSTAGRGYEARDREALLGLGISVSFLAVVVLALYFNSVDVTRLYSHSRRLWLLCPILLYWVSRTWILAHRGLVHDDPVVYALKDRTAWISLVLGSVILFWAK